MEAYPWEISDVESKVNKELIKHFTGEFTGFVHVGQKRYTLPHKFKVEAAKIYNMPIRSDDVFVATFPRSGTTWTQELVWMIANDLDYAKSDAVPLFQRFPFLEGTMLFHSVMIERLREKNKDSEMKLKIIDGIENSVVDQLAEMPSPRFVKSHLPMSLLPPSYLITYTPFFEHLKEAWEKRHHSNMLFLFYEELSKDLPAAVRRVSKFLNKEYTEDQIAGLCDHLSFDNFKKNKSVNFDPGNDRLGLFVKGEEPFIRKGKSGGWRDYFDEEMTQQADAWMQQNLRDTDLRFPHLEA
ncbi:sulfotransferase domain-containing protein [Phthorimaea operculella]|nr:sulfotransferase domain-containing protein [Phthorimaea operculella]